MEKEKRKEITDRTFKFGLMVINIANQIPKTPAGFAIANQLTRSGTSVGANIEEAQDGSSRKEFIKSMTIALKEARETRFWLKMAKELAESEELIKFLLQLLKIPNQNLNYPFSIINSQFFYG